MVYIFEYERVYLKERLKRGEQKLVRVKNSGYSWSWKRLNGTEPWHQLILSFILSFHLLGTV